MSDLLSDLRYRFRTLFNRSTIERELNDELQFHIEREAAKLEASGIAPPEAMRRSRLSFGGIERIKDDTRDVSGVSWLETFMQDLRYAMRGLRARPIFTIAVVLTLGLGIGANVAMFGIVDQLLLRAPRYLRDAERVHRVYVTSFYDGRDNTQSTIEYARYVDFSRLSRTIEAAAAFTQRDFAVGVGEDAREMPVGMVSASFWSFFDAAPALGRYFTAAEDSVPTGSPVVVLSYALWQARYGGRSDVIGQPIQIGPVPCTIIGVAPAGFVGIADEGAPVAFIPVTLYGHGVSQQRGRIDYYTTYHWSWLSMLVRRKPDATIAATNADLTNAYRVSWGLERAQSVGLQTADAARARASAEPTIRERGPNASSVAKVAVWIAGVATIVLLIACANVANLLLARAISRRREIALRLALGASHGRVLSQLLTESLLLGALGGVAGVVAAQWGGATLRALFLREPETAAVIGDARILAFAGVAALLTGLLAGIAPAIRGGRLSLAPTLKSGLREGTYQRSRLRTALLIGQGALSVLLLVGAGLFVRSLHNVRSIRLGYDVDRVAVVSPNLRGLTLPVDQRAELARKLVAAAAAMPDVEAAARGISVPFWSNEGIGFFVPGIDSVRKFGRFSVQMASSDYFRTMGTRILRGRPIADVDRAGSQRVTVVSQSMAEVLWPGKDPIGQCIMLDARTAPCSMVVGVAEDIRQNTLSGQEDFLFYVPIEQLRPEEAVVFVRTRGEAGAHGDAIRRALQKVMPGAGNVAVTPMRDVIDPQQRSWQVGATMFLVFGGLALVLAAIGLYSVIAYGVVQRTQEIGVRIALGAGARDVVRLVLGEGVRFALAGIVLGGAIALGAGRWLGPLLFSVSPRDPMVYGVVAAVLLAAAVLASAIPAVRASRVDPNVALRGD
jgi:predicted permease